MPAREQQLLGTATQLARLTSEKVCCLLVVPLFGKQLEVVDDEVFMSHEALVSLLDAGVAVEDLSQPLLIRSSHAVRDLRPSHQNRRRDDSKHDSPLTDRPLAPAKRWPPPRDGRTCRRRTRHPRLARSTASGTTWAVRIARSRGRGTHSWTQQAERQERRGSERLTLDQMRGCITLRTSFGVSTVAEGGTDTLSPRESLSPSRLSPHPRASPRLAPLVFRRATSEAPAALESVWRSSESARLAPQLCQSSGARGAGRTRASRHEVRDARRRDAHVHSWTATAEEGRDGGERGRGGGGEGEGRERGRGRAAADSREESRRRGSSTGGTFPPFS